MRILNATRKTTVAGSAELARSIFSKAIGLMFRSGMKEGCGLLMEFGREDYHAIWMFAMRFPIDIVFIDGRKKVTAVFKRARPLGPSPRTWRLYRPPEPAKWVLELPAGGAAASGTRAGDTLSF